MNNTVRMRWVYVGLLLLSLPFLLLGFYFSEELVAKQELQLRRGYEHSADYIQSGMDSAVHELKHHLIFVGKNPVLQSILLGQVKDATQIPLLLNNSIEPYLWYHTTSNRRMTKKIVIYAEKPLSVGVFLRPLDGIRDSLGEKLIQSANAGRFFFWQDELCYAYRFWNDRGNTPLGLIVAWIDTDRLVSGRLPEAENIGLELRLEGRTLAARGETALPDPIRVVKISESTGMELTLLIPSQYIKAETGSVLAAVAIALLLLAITYAVLVRQVTVLGQQVEKEREKMEKMRLKALQAQINPHFLYNTLSMINWKAKYAGQPEISAIATLISDFYRTALNRGEDAIALSEELRNVRAYLEIKSMMMDGCFTYDIVCEPGLEETRIVSFILQPLVENALIHGIGPRGHGHIRVEAASRENDLCLSVTDDGPGFPEDAGSGAPKAEGYGMQNIHERVALLCGPGYGVRIVPADSGARIEILVKRMP